MRTLVPTCTPLPPDEKTPKKKKKARMKKCDTVDFRAMKSKEKEVSAFKSVSEGGTKGIGRPQ